MKEINWADIDRRVEQAVHGLGRGHAVADVKALLREVAGVSEQTFYPTTVLQLDNNWVWKLNAEGWQLYSDQGVQHGMAAEMEGPYRKANTSEGQILNAAKAQIEQSRHQMLRISQHQLVGTLVDAAHLASSKGHLTGTSNWAYTMANYLLKYGHVGDQSGQ